MANRPVLGPNVIRGGESTVDIWDDFFRNSSDVFGVPESKVIPYQAYLSTGDLNAASHGDFSQDIYFTNPAGIGEHSDILEAVQNELDKIALHEDRLAILRNWPQGEENEETNSE